MEMLIGRKVALVRLHGPTHVPGIGQIGPAIDEDSAKVKGMLKLVRSDAGVYCEFQNVNFEIPLANTQLIVYAPRPAQVLELKKK